MILNFKEIEQKAMQNFRGGNKEALIRMFEDDLCRIMYITLEDGASIGEHIHDTSSEVIYVLEGSGKAVYNGVEEKLVPGVCHYCPKGQTHTVMSDEGSKLVFFAVISQQ